MDLFALLRAGVRSGDTPDIGGLTDDRWRELYTAASSQGVSALVWDGIRRLPPESQPSRELRLRWAYNVERIERRYGQQRRRAAELAAAYAEAGIRTVVLKGLAVSRLYPVPEHRPCGDLDCFLCGDYERGNRVAEQVGAEVKRDFYKHSHIVFRGLTVENHRFCTAVRGSRRAKRFERHLQRLLAEGPLSCIPETALLVPPPDFNALFLVKHALSHFLTEGISLRHLCDWAVFIDREGDAVDWTAFRKVAAEDRLLRFGDPLRPLRPVSGRRAESAAGRRAGARRPGIGQYPLRAPAPERFAGRRMDEADASDRQSGARPLEIRGGVRAKLPARRSPAVGRIPFRSQS